MKITLLLAALFAFTATAPAADKPDEKKDRKNKNEKKEEKEEKIVNLFEVTVEGAKDSTAEADVKTYLSSIEGVKLEKAEKTEKGIEAVLSTKANAKISRGDVAKALKDNKDLKVSDFKAVRPGRQKDAAKDAPKDDKKK